MQPPCRHGEAEGRASFNLFWMLFKTDAVWPPPLLGSTFSCTQAFPGVAKFSDSCQ